LTAVHVFRRPFNWEKKKKKGLEQHKKGGRKRKRGGWRKKRKSRAAAIQRGS